MWRTPLLDKTLEAGATVRPYRIVKFGGTDAVVVEATAATDGIVGVSGQVGAASGALLDVTLVGIGEVVLGGSVTRGNQVTSDAAGAAVVAGAGNRVAGRALKSGVAGDVIPLLLG